MKYLKALRVAKGITQKTLAEYLECTEQTVANYENGKRKANYEMQLKIAEYFDVPLDYLFRGTVSPLPQKKKGVKIPILGKVAAGIPIEAIENIDDYEEIDEEMAAKANYFGLAIKGDSMTPQINEGDIVIVEQQSVVESGEIAIILINGQDAVCKKIFYYENGLSLISCNQNYPPMFFTPKEVQTLPITVLGKVVELRRKFL